MTTETVSLQYILCIFKCNVNVTSYPICIFTYSRIVTVRPHARHRSIHRPSRLHRSGQQRSGSRAHACPHRVQRSRRTGLPALRNGFVRRALRRPAWLGHDASGWTGVERAAADDHVGDYERGVRHALGGVRQARASVHVHAGTEFLSARLRRPGVRGNERILDADRDHRLVGWLFGWQAEWIDACERLFALDL